MRCGIAYGSEKALHTRLNSPRHCGSFATSADSATLSVSSLKSRPHSEKFPNALYNRIHLYNRIYLCNRADLYNRAFANKVLSNLNRKKRPSVLRERAGR